MFSRIVALGAILAACTCLFGAEPLAVPVATSREAPSGVRGSIDPSAFGPYWYRRDEAKSNGWMEISTPVLAKLRAEKPGQESGDARATSLTVAPNGDLILVSNQGVLRSRDRGATWTPIDGATKDTRASRGTGYPETSGSIRIDPEDSRRMAFLWFRGTSFYTDGMTWRQLPGPNGGLPGFDCASIDWTSAQPQLIAGPHHGTWILDITRDAGATWTSQDNRLTGTGELGSACSTSMVVVVDADVILYNNVASDPAKPSGLFRSTDKGNTWTQVGKGVNEVAKDAVALRDGRVYFAGEKKLWISKDKGVTWTTRPSPLASQGPFLFGDWSHGKIGGMLVKSCESVAYSKDEGQTWLTLIGPAQFPPKHELRVDGAIYLAKNTGGVYHADACDYRYGGSWAYDPVNNVIYASSGGGPVIMKQLPGPGPGPAAAAQ